WFRAHGYSGRPFVRPLSRRKIYRASQSVDSLALKIDRIGLKDGAALRHARDHRPGKAVALGFQYPARLPASSCLPSNDNAIGRPNFSWNPCRTFYQKPAVSIRDRLLENTGSVIGRSRRGVDCLRQRLADETRPERVMFGKRV